MVAGRGCTFADHSDADSKQADGEDREHGVDQQHGAGQGEFAERGQQQQVGDASGGEAASEQVKQVADGGVAECPPPFSGRQADAELDGQQHGQSRRDHLLVHIGQAEIESQQKRSDETQRVEHRVGGQDQCQAVAHRDERTG